MANTKTAKKQILINRRNRRRNVHYKTRMKNVIKRFLQVVEQAQEPTTPLQALKEAQKVIDSTASKGVIKKGTASRKVSRVYAVFRKKFGNAPLGT